MAFVVVLSRPSFAIIVIVLEINVSRILFGLTFYLSLRIFSFTIILLRIAFSEHYASRFRLIIIIIIIIIIGSLLVNTAKRV